MVFVFFGPTPDSWAVGNDYFSYVNNLPLPIRKAWERLENLYEDKSLAGTLVSWISTSHDGSYAIMTKGGELLSNHQDLLAVAQPHSSVEHIAISTGGGCFIRFTDGSIQLISLHALPPSFHSLASNLIDTNTTSRQPSSRISRVFFPANGGIILGTDRGLLTDGLSDSLSSSIQSFTYGDMWSAGFSLGKNTALCPWNANYFFVEVEPSIGPPRYLHQFPPNQLTSELLEAVMSNQRPPPHILQAQSSTIHQPPLVRGAVDYLHTSFQMPPDVRGRFESLFDDISGGKAYLTGTEAGAVFSKSGLNQPELAKIWYQSNVNQDGRFDKNEFVQAMWLVKLQTEDNRIQPWSSNVPPSPYHNNREASSSYSGYRPPPPLQQYPPTAPHPQFAQASYPPPPPYPAGPPQQQWQDPRLLQSRIKTVELSTAMICPGCDVGLVPEDTIYQCDSCPEVRSRICETCYNAGKICQHRVEQARLVRGQKLKIADKDGSLGLGFGYKCDAKGCGKKIKRGELLWSCRRCFDPYLCQECWRKSERRCKHASQGKVTLKLVEKAKDDDDDDDEEWEALFNGLGALAGS